jgi:tight adherence protein B
MNIVLLGLMIFIISLFVLELFLYAIRLIRYPDRPEIKRRLETLESHDPGELAPEILKKRVLSDVPLLNRILPYIPGMVRLDFMIKQANLKYTLGFFVLSGAALGFTGYLLSSVLTGNHLLGILIVPIVGCLPFVYVHMKKNKRMAKFEKQLPEGLGLIARALRAGHAFTSAMKFASEEFEDPLGPEFQETLDEINFGVNVPNALKNITRRVDCPDLKFFVVSVVLQRETGGNLAEIIESLADLIRQRFKFRGKIKVLTAEGKMSAAILVAIPFVVFGAIFLTSPKYLTPLLTEPIGRMLMAAGGIMMSLGVVVIRRIIQVDL